MKNLYKLTMLLIALVLSTSLMAVDYYVDPSGTDDGSHGSGPGTNAWKTIQYALTNVSDPTTATIVIHIAAGTYYTPAPGDDIDFERSFTNITVQGEGPGSTIVQAHATQGSATKRVFDIHTGNTVTIKKMTIRHGNTVEYNKGGGALESSGTLTLEHCSIKNNGADKGGGIYIDNSTMTINNCTISDNSILDVSHNGGGIYINGISTLTLTNVTISGNSAGTTSGAGGGIHIQNASGTASISLTNCTIANNNSGGNGKGIYEYASSSSTNNLTLKNCIISNGTSSNYVASGSGTHNLTRTYTLVRDASMSITGTGNSNSSDPLLSALALNNNTNGTYTQAIPSGSPAKNAGTSSGAPSTDQRGASRIGTTDMGAYENHNLTWDGSSSTSWATADNWTPAIAPTTFGELSIPGSLTNYPTISSSATCYTLDIVSGASLTIAYNGNLTTLGNFSNAGTFTINSTGSGTGSLIHNTAGVNATVERYLTEMKWHFVSTPINNAKFEVFQLPGSHSNIYAKYWDEVAGDWVVVDNTNDDMNVMQGYGIWVDNTGTGQDEIIEFEGTLNNDVATAYTLTNTTANADDGWNLVGNPYPSALDWDAASGWTKTNIDNTVYFWNGSSGNYSYYVGTGGPAGVVGVSTDSKYIPAMQGFYVHCTGTGSPNGSITIQNGARVHNAQAFYKKTEDYSNLLKLKAVGNGYWDKTVVRFFDGAAEGFDSDFDAYKLYGNDDAPQLYSIIAEEILAINSLPVLDEYRIVPLGFECDVPALFTIEASEIESFEGNITIYLEDIKEGTLYNLSNNPSYTFTHEIGNDPNRFLLHFGNPNDINETDQHNIRIYSNENIVYVQQPAGLQVEIVVYNILGQEIKREIVNNEELTRIRVTNGTGYYIVKVKTGKQLLTQKVFIR